MIAGETAVPSKGPTSANNGTADPETPVSHTWPDTTAPPQTQTETQPPVEEDSMVVKTTPQWSEFSRSHRSDLVSSIVADTEILLDESDEIDEHTARGCSCCLPGCCGRVFHQVSENGY